jgi:hypothetical protein
MISVRAEAASVIRAPKTASNAMAKTRAKLLFFIEASKSNGSPACLQMKDGSRIWQVNGTLVTAIVKNLARQLLMLLGVNGQGAHC